MVPFNQTLLEATELLERGQLAEARARAGQALQARPGNPLAESLLGVVLFCECRFSEAYGVFEHLVRRHPDVVPLRINAGLSALRCDEMVRAAEHLRRAADLDPTHRRALAYLGLLHFRRGERATAKALLLKAGLGELAEKLAEEADLQTTVSLAMDLEAEADALAVETQEEGAYPLPFECFTEVPPLANEPAAGHDQPAHGTAPPALGAACGPATPDLEWWPPSPLVSPPPASPLSRPVSQDPLGRGAASSGATPDALLGSTSPEPPPDGAGDTPPQGPGADPSYSGFEGDCFAALSPVAAAVFSTSSAVPAEEDASLPASCLSAPADLAAGAAEERPAPSGRPASCPVTAISPPAAPAPRALPPAGLEQRGLRLAATGPAAEIVDGLLVLRPAERPAPEERPGAILRQGLLLMFGGEVSWRDVERRSRGSTCGPFLCGGDPLVRVDGDGLLLLHPGPRDRFELLQLDDSGLFLRESVLAAFAGALAWENGRIPGPDRASPAILHLRGSGFVALRSPGALATCPVSQSSPLTLRLERLLGWTSGVVPVVTNGPAGLPQRPSFADCCGDGLLLLALPFCAGDDGRAA